MGYLQVRDFPEELHEQLRERAKAEQRSVSQQTIVAIKEHVDQADGRAQAIEAFNTYEHRRKCDEIDYLAKRKKVFERIAAFPILDSTDSPEDIMQVIFEGREELDARIG